MSPRLRALLGLAGGALGAAGILFVARRLYQQSTDIDWTRFGVGAWMVIAMLALVYCAANVMLARGWWSLLSFFGSPVRFRWSVRAYGLSQLAKYVPGNVFQIAGRQAIGLAAGLPGWALAKSAAWELGSLACVGALFSVLLAPAAYPAVPVVAAVVAFLGVLVVAVAGVSRWIDWRVAACIGWQAAFLAITGALFIGTLATVERAPALTEMPGVCGAYVIAWLAGLVTPGAPAGAGVRELVILFLLGSQFAGPGLLIAVVVLRIVTVIGDVCFFAASSSLAKAQPV